ncbi:MAG: 2-oxoglutarate oxidoreductase [Ignavibacteriales bacterium CG18_big_fil_WC_8_21_14_2_50_31_20]|nr:MAG: 2-oxoglutarate oxidoreductase [Ignavibacteriales bacterium CG18_big_fil_WC_8_21_14_2_50_31_20]
MNVETLDTIKTVVFEKTESLLDVEMHYCPGCGHSVTHRLIAEVIDELGIVEETIGVAPVGCSVFAYNYIGVDFSEAAHGRASAAATGIKRVFPEKYVFSYQGDGDLAAIGTGETIHTCNRGENILIIFINNGIYGMTGGQMAPTTLPNMKSTTSPFGRDTKSMGYPLKITDLVAQLPGTYYVTRQSVHKPLNVRRAKKAIQKGFEYQKLNKGTCFIEIVSNCPSNWKMTPVESNKWLDENMLPFYPLGDLKVPNEKEV